MDWGAIVAALINAAVLLWVARKASSAATSAEKAHTAATASVTVSQENAKTLKTVIEQTNGMNKTIERLAEQKGAAAGHEQGLAEGRAEKSE